MWFNSIPLKKLIFYVCSLSAPFKFLNLHYALLTPFRPNFVLSNF